MTALIERVLIVTTCVLLTLGRGVEADQAREEFRIDAASSSMVVHVGRAGLFAFAGHDHEVAVPALEGGVILDRADVTRSSVAIQFDATTMTVTGRGEPPEDVPEVRRVMLSDRVLDVKRHPRIAFASRSISLVEGSSDRIELRIEGSLTLKGITRPVSVPVEVRLLPEILTATGKTSVRQTLFDIRPVTAGAGTVRVKDEVDIVFTLVARRL